MERAAAVLGNLSLHEQCFPAVREAGAMQVRALAPLCMPPPLPDVGRSSFKLSGIHRSEEWISKGSILDLHDKIPAMVLPV